MIRSTITRHPQPRPHLAPHIQLLTHHLLSPPQHPTLLLPQLLISLPTSDEGTFIAITQHPEKTMSPLGHPVAGLKRATTIIMTMPVDLSSVFGLTFHGSFVYRLLYSSVHHRLSTILSLLLSILHFVCSLLWPFLLFFSNWSSFLITDYDSTGTVQRFINEFESQFGSVHPPFSPETYTSVIAKAKRDLRFALIYVHSPIHRDTERFCRTVIATERFSQFVTQENLIFWSCNSFFPDGYSASQAVSFTSYPFLFLIGLKNGKMVILRTFEGFQGIDVLTGRIKTAIDNNEVHLISARMDRETNIVNSLIRQQQDAALEESLRKDQEKERMAREEEEKKAEAERKVQEEKDQEERRFQSIMELKVTLLGDLVAEPEVDQKEAIKLLFRLPNGKRLERRFLKSHPVKQLYYFVFCNDESLINFKLKTNFPTRELPGHSPIPEIDRESQEMNMDLLACELENNIVLFVHDLDA